jgi:iron complex outermembrane recepter protein
VASARRTPTPFEEQNNWRYNAPPALVAQLAALPLPFSALAALPLAQSSITPAALHDEKILSREIGYLGEFPSLRLHLDVVFFDDRIKDLVGQYALPVSTIFGFFSPGYRYCLAYDNLNWANRHGTNVEIGWRRWQGARLNVAASRTIIESSDISVVDSTTSPRHTASTLFSQELPADTTFSVGYYRVGSMHWIGSSTMLPAYDRVDFRLGKRFRWGGNRMEVSWVTQNTFDPIPVIRPSTLDKRTSWLRLQYEY